MSELVTFAGPRVGDAAFASSFDAALGKQTTTNLYHDLDPVLAQNQPLWDALGFVHAGRTAAGQGGLARCPLCPGWLAAARAAARRISSAPACFGLPSAPERSPPLPRLDAEDALRRQPAAAAFCCPAHGRDSSLSPEIRTRPLCRPPCRPRALLCDRAEAAASGGGAQRAAAQLCRPRVVPWHLPRATGGLVRGGGVGLVRAWLRSNVINM